MFRNQLMIEGVQQVRFKEAKLVKGDDNNPFYLQIIYQVESLAGFFEVVFPKIAVSTSIYRLPEVFEAEDVAKYYDPTIYNSNLKPLFLEQRLFVKLDDDSDVIYPLIPDEREHLYYIKCLREKEKEMTLSEIEKRLGHKIKLVSKKGDSNEN